MSWNDLVYAGLRVVPFDGPLPPSGRRRALFSATFTATTRLLRRELEHLDAKRLVIELDIRERDIRLDGYPRADARPVASPAVRVTFESRHGPVRMETGEFTSWQDNLRAVALSLEALRAVDRYGVSKRGEQYKGWKALPVSTDPADAVQTTEQAWAVLAAAAGLPRDTSPLKDGIGESELVKRALRATHPDQGGDSDEFRKVIRAREILGA